MKNNKKTKEKIKEHFFINNMFYIEEIEAYYTDDEKIIKENINGIIENIKILDANKILAPIDAIIQHDYFLKIIAHVITGKNNITLDEEYLNRLIKDYDKINAFFNREGDNAYKIIDIYDDIIEKDYNGFYELNNAIVNKVIKDNDFYISNLQDKEYIKEEIFNTWENQKEILTQDSLNSYSEKRNGINFKHFIFCEEYIKRGKIKPTCEHLGISRNTAYLWLKDEKVQDYLKQRQDEIKKETDNTFIQTYQASFNELNKMINSNYIENSDKIKAIDVFLKHYENIEKLKQPQTTYED